MWRRGAGLNVGFRMRCTQVENQHEVVKSPPLKAMSPKTIAPRRNPQNESAGRGRGERGRRGGRRGRRERMENKILKGAGI